MIAWTLRKVFNRLINAIRSKVQNSGCGGRIGEWPKHCSGELCEMKMG